MDTQIKIILKNSPGIKDIQLSRIEKDAIWKNLPTLTFFNQYKHIKIPIINLINEYSNKIALAVESNDFETIYEKDSKEFFSPLLQDINIRMLFFQFIYIILVAGSIHTTGLLNKTKEKVLHWFGQGARTVEDLYRLLLNYIPKKYWDYFDIEDIQNILYLLTIYDLVYTHLCPDAAGRVFSIRQSEKKMTFYMNIKRMFNSTTTNNIPIIQEEIKTNIPIIQEEIKTFVSGKYYSTSAIGDMTREGGKILFDEYKEFIDIQKLKKLLKKGRFTKHNVELEDERSQFYAHNNSTVYNYKKIRKDVLRTFSLFGLVQEPAIENYLEKVDKYLKKYVVI